MKTLKQLLALLLALTMLLALALPAGAVEKETSPIKKAIAQVKSGKSDYFGTSYVYPFASFYDATLVKGSNMLFRFRKNPDLSCPNNYSFCLVILRGNIEEMDYDAEPEIIEERIIPMNKFSTYGNGNALACALTWTADSRYPVGDYTAMCFTMDPEGMIEDNQLIYVSSLRVVSSAIPLTDLEFYSSWDGNFFYEDTKVYDWGSEVYLLPSPVPLSATTPRNKISVSSSNSSYVSAAVEDDYVVLRGKTYGAPATITVTCGNITKKLDIMFGEIPSVSAKQGKQALCPGETDQVTYAPTGYLHSWRSSNTDVVTVKDGLVTAVGPGTADVTLSMGFQTVKLQYTVKPHVLPADASIVNPTPTATKPSYQIGKCSVCGKENAVNILKPAIFTDTAPNAWYSDHVDYLFEQNIITGITPALYKPNQSLTRGQMATVLYRIAGSPEVTSECPFTDIASGKYYYRAVLWAAENGIVTGYTDQTFRPDNKITREQIATILYRYTQFSETAIEGDPALLEAFPDAGKVANYAKPALAWAVQEALITGVATEDGTFLMPKNNASRAQIATILSRYLNPAPEA